MFQLKKMSKPRLLHALALIACTSILATPTLAQFSGGFGLFGGGLGLPDFQKCLTAGNLGVNGCFPQLISSVLRVQPQLVGPACCKAFLQIDESCWPTLVPLNPNFPPELKNYCVGIQDSPQPPPPPPETPPPPPETPPPPPETPPPPCSADAITNSTDGGDRDIDD